MAEIKDKKARALDADYQAKLAEQQAVFEAPAPELPPMVAPEEDDES